MYGCLKVLHKLIANMILFLNINNFLKWNFIHIMTCSVADWDTWEDSYAFYYVRGILVSILP